MFAMQPFEVFMFEVIGTLVESLAGYVGGKFARGKVSSFFASICVGFIFFIGYFLYEFFLSSQINIRNVFFLMVISVVVTALTYLFLFFCIWLDKKKG